MVSKSNGQPDNELNSIIFRTHHQQKAERDEATNVHRTITRKASEVSRAHSKLPPMMKSVINLHPEEGTVCKLKNHMAAIGSF